MKKKKINKISLFIILISLIVIALIVKQGYKYHKLNNELQAEFKILNEEYEQKKLLKEKLEDQNKKINSSEEIEKLAREKLNMKKEGERVFKIVGNNLEEKESDIKPLNNSKKENNEKKSK